MPISNESSDRISTRAEQVIAESLLLILNTVAIGERIQESPELQNVLNALESFIPEVMEEIHSEWKHESLDGVFPLIAEKTGERTVSVFGQCILISDQTVVPILVELQVNQAGSNVNWLECKLGAKGRQGMVRIPYQLSSMTKLLYSLDGRKDLIDWAYKVTFGQKYP